MAIAITIDGADFNDATLLRRGADRFLTGGTVHMFDFGNVAGYPAQSSPISMPVNDIAPAGRISTAAGVGSFTYAGGGVVSTGLTSNRGFRWESADYNLEPLQDGGHFVMCLWAKPDSATLARGAANVNVPVGYRIGDLAAARQDTDTFLGLGITPDSWSLLSGGVAPTTTQLVSAEVAVTQIAVEVFYETGASTLLVRTYKNGAFVDEKPMTYADWTAASTPAVVVNLPNLGANFHCFNGSIYRGFIENAGLSRIDVARWIYDDYQANSARFS